jgi:hypothetical protein
VDGFDPVDDWPCAASSVLRVDGDSCEPALSGAELVEAEAGLAISNGSTALKPEDFAEDAPDEASALTASSAAVAAPRASNMAELRPWPRRAANFPRRWISKPRAIQKNPTKPRFFIARTAQRPRQLMPLRQNFPPR